MCPLQCRTRRNAQSVMRRLVPSPRRFWSRMGLQGPGAKRCKHTVCLGEVAQLHSDSASVALGGQRQGSRCTGTHRQHHDGQAIESRQELDLPLEQGGGHLRIPHTTWPAPLRAKDHSKSEGREIRTPNLLIWSQTRYRCAIPPCSTSSHQKLSRLWFVLWEAVGYAARWQRLAPHFNTS